MAAWGEDFQAEIGAGEQVAQGGKGYAQLVGNASGAGKEILKKDGSEKASITLTGFGL